MFASLLFSTNLKIGKVLEYLCTITSEPARSPVIRGLKF